MEESDAGPVPTARVDSGAAGVLPAQSAGLPVACLRVLAARTVGHGQQGGNRQHQPVAAHTRPQGAGSKRRVLCHLQPTVFRPRKPCSIQLRQAYRVGSVSATWVSVSSTQGCL